MKKLALFVIFLLFVVFIYFDFGQYFTIDFFIAKKREIDNLYSNSPISFVLSYFIFFVFCTALSIPGAAILTLVSGFIFDFFLGCLIVSMGSTIGATGSFLMSRFLLKDFVQKKFHSRLQTINKGFKKEGAFYLFSLRLIPIFPFFAVNWLMGVTPISVRSFFVASLLGMLPGTFVYVNAGSHISDMKSLVDIFSPFVILSFLLLASLPWIMKLLIRFFPLKRKSPV